jgi:heme-degrading monooxygenase HmoA
MADRGEDVCAMLVRIWRTGVKPERVAEYERFARERSLPMFRRRPGCLGVLFSRSDGGVAVVSFWQDAAAIQRFDSDPEYAETVEAILAAGFLTGAQTVEVLTVNAGWLATERLR